MTGAPAVLTISRDRRGYEHFYLVQPASHRRGRGPARILYWFRTPPGIKVGRPPFDEEMRRRIEAQNPGVTFDWAQLEATPAPPLSAAARRKVIIVAYEVENERFLVQRLYGRPGRRALGASATAARASQAGPTAETDLHRPHRSRHKRRDRPRREGQLRSRPQERRVRDLRRRRQAGHHI